MGSISDEENCVICNEEKTFAEVIKAKGMFDKRLCFKHNYYLYGYLKHIYETSYGNCYIHKALNMPFFKKCVIDRLNVLKE